MKPSRFALAALCLSFGAASLRAQTAESAPVDVAAWAGVLIESPNYLTDDRDARAFELLDLIERAPDHPLVELGLRVLRDFRADRQKALLERCLALDGSHMTPIARGELEALRITCSEQLATIGVKPPADLGRDRLSPALLIGPLPDVYDAARRRELLEGPGFERDHRGYPGVLQRWTPEPRTPFEVYVDPDQMLGAAYGWGGVAFGFKVAGGGPAWVELDFGGDSGPAWTTTRAWQDGGALAQIDDPSVDVRINDGEIQHVDFLASERSPIVRFPVALRDGGNRVVLALNLGARVRFSLRVLDSEGRAHSKLEALDFVPDLGLAISSKAPSSAPTTAVSWLKAQGDTSPLATAMLGAAQLWFGETIEGSRRLQEAVQADPTLVGARMWLAEFFNDECYAPQTWARSRARALLDALVAEDATNVRAVSDLASIAAAEDREGDALALLRGAQSAAPASPQQPLDVARLYDKLELEVPVERALLEAAERAPESSRALNALAQHWQEAGQLERAAAIRQQSLLANGGWASTLANLAQADAVLGRVDEALAHRRRAAELGGQEQSDDLGDYLQSLQRYDEAAAIYRDLAALRPKSPYYVERLADLAHLQGDKKTELANLRRALELSPSDESLRARLRALGESHPADAFFERWSIDPAKELAGFDATHWDDHVVRAIDAAAVYLFDDGSWEQVSHSRSVARDLEGCEELGAQSEREEMLDIATIKAEDGRRYEPVLVSGQYVMPSLKPGDTVELVWRNTGAVDREGRLVLPQWSFASVTEPFFLSRYVISAPKALGLEMALRNFTGEHRTIDEGERVTHVFEMRDVARVTPEPVSPPPTWYLPWVQFGTARSKESMAGQARVDLAAALRVTPQIAEAAANAIAGVDGQEARARKLHAFVSTALDKRSQGLGSATAALLQREGNPSILYSALLSAAGIDNEIVWSRGVDPRADQDPDPAFVDLGRWMGRMLVVVRPSDGAEAWCNLGVKTMPYGEMLLDAPRAEALSAMTGRFLEVPDEPLASCTGEHTDIKLHLSPDRSAQISIEFHPTGNVGFMWKEGLREAPKPQLKQIATRIATQIVRGVDLDKTEWVGLDNDDVLVIQTAGAHKRYLDAQKDEFTCKLPFPALQLSGLASGEGERTQPFHFPQALVRSWTARFELDPQLRLIDGPGEADLTYGDAHFVQTVRPDGDHAFVVERSLLAPPLSFAPEQFAGFVEFCKQVDDLDRAKLRFQKVE